MTITLSPANVYSFDLGTQLTDHTSFLTITWQATFVAPEPITNFELAIFPGEFTLPWGLVPTTPVNSDPLDPTGSTEVTISFTGHIWFSSSAEGTFPLHTHIEAIGTYGQYQYTETAAQDLTFTARTIPEPATWHLFLIFGAILLWTRLGRKETSHGLRHS